MPIACRVRYLVMVLAGGFFWCSAATPVVMSEESDPPQNDAAVPATSDEAERPALSRDDTSAIRQQHPSAAIDFLGAIPADLFDTSLRQLLLRERFLDTDELKGSSPLQQPLSGDQAAMLAAQLRDVQRFFPLNDHINEPQRHFSRRGAGVLAFDPQPISRMSPEAQIARHHEMLIAARDYADGIIIARNLKNSNLFVEELLWRGSFLAITDPVLRELFSVTDKQVQAIRTIRDHDRPAVRDYFLAATAGDQSESAERMIEPMLAEIRDLLTDSQRSAISEVTARFNSRTRRLARPDDDSEFMVQSNDIMVAWTRSLDALHGFSMTTGKWSTIQIDDQERIQPIVASHVAYVPLGNSIAAYSGPAGRWDVATFQTALEFQYDLLAAPFTLSNFSIAATNTGITARVEDRIYVFSAAHGRWTSFNDPKAAAGFSEASDEQPDMPSLSRVSDFDRTPGHSSLFGNDATGDPAQVPNELSLLREKYNVLEQRSIELAALIQAGGGRRVTDEDRARLQSLVSDAFEIRQQLQTVETDLLAKKLQVIRENLRVRQQNRDRIVGRRLEELLDPRGPSTMWSTPQETSGDIEAEFSVPADDEAAGQSSVARREPAGVESEDILNVQPAELHPSDHNAEWDAWKEVLDRMRRYRSSITSIRGRLTDGHPRVNELTRDMIGRWKRDLAWCQLRMKRLEVEVEAARELLDIATAEMATLKTAAPGDRVRNAKVEKFRAEIQLLRAEDRLQYYRNSLVDLENPDAWLKPTTGPPESTEKQETTNESEPPSER